MFTRPLLFLLQGKAGSLPAFLRFHRKRIPPGVTTLGAYRRLPKRIGKPVTQEEMAEALGVTRTWYALLECSFAQQPSLRLLKRIAAALTLDNVERAHLFALALGNDLAPQSSNERLRTATQ